MSVASGVSLKHCIALLWSGFTAAGATGTRFPMYRPTRSDDDGAASAAVSSAASTHVFGAWLHHITAMAEYSKLSAEELRWQDYQVES